MDLPIADLHCDLLSYLESFPSHRTADDPESQCSIPLLKQGGVIFQVLAIYTETGNQSVQKCENQVSLAQKLLQSRSTKIFPLQRHAQLLKPLTVAIAIENGSGILEEGEKFELCFKRVEQIQEKLPLLYISFTWNSENRFGGGNESQVGLKREGEILLDFLDKRGIAIDLSHTSDRLAHDIFNYIDKKKLQIQPIASHSNFRKITNNPRNLPDEIARELIRRKGVIGINFLRSLIGDEPADFITHIQHGIDLGGKDALCFGADFFGEIDTPSEYVKLLPFYFPGFNNSSCYPRLLDMLQSKFSKDFLESLAHKNLARFLSFI